MTIPVTSKLPIKCTFLLNISASGYSDTLPKSTEERNRDVMLEREEDKDQEEHKGQNRAEYP